VDQTKDALEIGIIYSSHPEEFNLITVRIKHNTKNTFVHTSSSVVVG
jgi:hypothetical protein